MSSLVDAAVPLLTLLSGRCYRPPMALRPIVLYPDPVLLTPTETVGEIDEEIRLLVRDMVETMYAAPGIGLAANQVGVSKRVCVVDLSVGEREDELKVFVNPRLVQSEGSEVAEEGCLSFPDIHLDIERFFTATVEAVGLDGQPFTLIASGLLARAIQHEIEHLSGRVFLQNVSPLKRELIKRQIKKRIKAGDWLPVFERPPAR
jgi:peptide deformylase